MPRLTCEFCTEPADEDTCLMVTHRDAPDEQRPMFVCALHGLLILEALAKRGIQP
jgi:hypothetical protein